MFPLRLIINKNSGLSKHFIVTQIPKFILCKQILLCDFNVLLIIIYFIICLIKNVLLFFNQKILSANNSFILKKYKMPFFFWFIEINYRQKRDFAFEKYSMLDKNFIPCFLFRNITREKNFVSMNSSSHDLRPFYLNCQKRIENGNG